MTEKSEKFLSGDRAFFGLGQVRVQPVVGDASGSYLHQFALARFDPILHVALQAHQLAGR